MMDRRHAAAGLVLALAALPIAARAQLAQRLFAVDPRLMPASLSSQAPAELDGPRLDLSWRQPADDHDATDLIQALLLPGTDQLQHGQWVKGALFLAVETGVLLLSSDLRRQGDELDKDFKDFANDNWSYERYVGLRQAPGEFAREEGYLDRNIDPAALAAASTTEELAALFAATGDDEFSAEGGLGSHPLPGAYVDGFGVGDSAAWDHFVLSRTQQFYEMIGKYAQFQRGWSGYGAGNGWELSSSDLAVAKQGWSVGYFCPQALHYMEMRQDSNDKLIAADRLFGLLIANHAASFLDVLIQLRKEDGQRAELGCRAVPLATANGPLAGLGISWRF